MVNLAIRVGGVAGAGVSVTALVLARIIKEHGYYIQTFRDIPSRIRGGHTSETVIVSDKPSFSPSSKLDVVMAFDNESIIRYGDLLRENGYLLVDAGAVKTSNRVERVKLLEIPATKLAREKLKSDLYRNTIIVGFLSEMFGLDKSIVRSVLSRIYGRKGEKVVNLNFEAIEIGSNYFKENYKDLETEKLERRDIKEKMLLLTGNDAIALGAIVAGCRFFAGYPITPATQVLERLVNLMPKFGGVALQTEDEIAAINSVIGAALAGVRAMTATSGPGFSLMTEAISLAGMAEVPIVIVNSNRAGPSTGMPTKTEQSDLLFTIFQGHGEFPKAVIAPSNAEEAFYFTVEAFNLADLCQCPVVLLVDEFISHGYQTSPFFDLNRVRIDRGYIATNYNENLELFPRYKITNSGVSQNAFPGKTPGIFVATGLEHDEYGYPTEDENMRTKMMDKRLRKSKLIKSYLEKHFKSEIIGYGDGNIGLIAFGSVVGPAVATLELFREKNIDVKVLKLRYLWPFPEEDVRNFVEKNEKTFIVEMNATGQLYSLVKVAVGSSDKIYSIRKYDGRLFTPLQIFERIIGVIE